MTVFLLLLFPLHKIFNQQPANGVEVFFSCFYCGLSILAQLYKSNTNSQDKCLVGG